MAKHPAAALLENYTEFKEGYGRHRFGIPSGFVKILRTTRNENSNGYTAVVVYRDRVVTMTLPYPTFHNDWRAVRVSTYDTLEELREVLDRATAPLKRGPDASCWVVCPTCHRDHCPGAKGRVCTHW